MKSIRIAQITDLHLDEPFQIENGIPTRKNALTILEDLKQKRIDRVVCTGDIGMAASHSWLFEQLNGLGIPFHVILGNHDEYTEVRKFYDVRVKSNPGELYYSLEEHPYKYLFLDTSSSAISSEQLSWIGQEVQSPKELIIFSHHPILPTGTTPQREFPLKGDKAVQQLLDACDRRVVIFCGHLHMDQYSTSRNIEQYICPASCIQVKKQSDTTEIDSKNFGYRIIEISGNGCDEHVIMFEPD